MPIIRYVPQDPTDVVLQGEHLRQGVLDPNNLLVDPGLIGGSTVRVDPFILVLQDEDAFFPMNSYCEIGRMGVRRAKNGEHQQRANAGISTPCGAWVSLDWSPLLRDTVTGYEQAFLDGVTRDSTGTALPAATVKIFRTINDTKLAELVSDASTGAWSLQLGAEPGPFWYNGYKAGSPDKAGASINTNSPRKVN